MASDTPTDNGKGASLLFAASGHCDLALVTELIVNGVSVNAVVSKKTGWTPLHAAINWDPLLGFEKRKPVIEYLVANGADLSALTSDGSPMWTLCPRKEPALTLLIINLGMSLNQRCPLSGRTVLHHFASNYDSSQNKDAVAVVELLLAKGADLKALDNFGLTPLNLAAIGSVTNKLRGYPNEPVLRCLLQQDEIDVSMKITALELAGAVILIGERLRRKSSVSEAFKFWNEAQDLRESVGLIPKIVKDLSIKNIPWRATEWTTRTHLEELENCHHSSNTLSDNWEIQAILISRRILSSISSITFVHLLWKVVFRSRNYQRGSDSMYAQELDVCWAILEGVRVLIDPGDEDLWKIVVQITCRLVSTLKQLQTERSPLLSLETLELSLQLVLDTNKSHFAFDQENRRLFSTIQTVEPLVTIYQLVILLIGNQEMMTKEIRSCLHQFVKRDDRDDFGRNLLLLTCDGPYEPEIIRLLLEVGADATVKNDEGNGPLHLVSTHRFPTAADLLFAYGAQPDQRNLKGETPLDVWKSTQRNYPQRPAPMWATNTVQPLSFWCARSLRRSQIPLDKLPESLRKFLLHPK